MEYAKDVVKDMRGVSLVFVMEYSGLNIYFEVNCILNFQFQIRQNDNTINNFKELFIKLSE